MSVSRPQKGLIQTPSTIGRREIQQTLEQELMLLLTVYVTLRSPDPIDAVLNDLSKLETEAAQFLGRAIPKMAKANLNGALTGILTAIPFPAKAIARKKIKSQSRPLPKKKSRPKPR